MMPFSRSYLIRLWRVFLRRISQWVHTNTERMRTTEHIFMISAAVLIGVLGGGGAIGFRWLIDTIKVGFHPDWGGSLAVIAQLPWYIVVGIPTMGGLIVGVLIYYSTREARGLPDVMEAVALRGGRINPRVVVETSLATALSIGSGLSVGREGPIAHIGSAIGSTLGQIFKVNTQRLRTFVGCGAAAGIAATFNAPIAGALFSLEVILGNFAFSQFSPIVVASVVATAISRHYLGNEPAIAIPPHSLSHPFELTLYAGLGIVAALAGTLFVKVLYGTEDVYRKVPLPDYLKPMTGGLLVGVMALFYPQVLGVGYEAMDQALFMETAWPLMLILIFMKITATSVTLGSGASGGVFAPSLFIGCMVGGAYGVLVNNLFPEMTGTSSAYALVAMGAVASSTSRTPLTSILMIFEMIGDYTLILPLMISCILSTALSAYLLKHSIYTLRLHRRGVDLEKGQESNILRSLTVKQARTSSFETIPPQAPLDDLMVRLAESPHTEFYITDDEQKYQGVVTFDNIRNLVTLGDELDGVIVAHDIARFDIPAVTDREPLDHVMLLFGQYHVNAFPVVDQVSRVLVGVIDREHVMDAYNREIARRDLAGEFNSMVETFTDRQLVQLGDNYAMVEIDAPKPFIGRSLSRLRIRRQYGVQILLIKQPRENGHTAHFVPTPDYIIKDDDVLLLAGDQASIQRARNL